MSQWFEIAIETSSEAVDAVANFLMEEGAGGIQIDDAADFQGGAVSQSGVLFDPDSVPHRRAGAKVSGYFAGDAHPAELVATLKARVAQLPAFGLAMGAGTVTAAPIAQADWANEWKKYYRPLRITRYLTIVPAWLDYQPQQAGEQVMRLDPDMAFGTGSHPTTALMLRLLEELVRGGETMIDVGTGSGVLALAARLMGAAQVLATDVDEGAVQNAKANLALNAVDQITVVESDLLNGIDLKADLIAANILANVLLPLIPQVPARLKPHGRLLLSGIYLDKVAAVKQALSASGLKCLAQYQLGDWVALVAGHEQEDPS
ncbi:50S ribosomal protein L11 methyltransferase [Lacticaseibacillus jixianensis]|uniref:Ribosomal protein L11 methyltransferase n=1 Tax=Lacticaseibacillus jixianensis TaxID=2486012 RepID=A0ABW4BB25_9LACO|nr:50S ribosomal protein L11 methyltransferase [Lacticaseibacillus jixianensis]